MRMLSDSRSLVQVRVRYENNTWTIQYNRSVRVFHGNIEEFAKFLQRIKASDDKTEPRSVRNFTYMQIAQEIQTGSDPIIWVWSNILARMTDFNLE
jgi:hypothetical protein